MTCDEALLDANFMVARRHGERAACHAASQIAHFLQENELEAVDLLEEIAARIPLALGRMAATPS